MHDFTLKKKKSRILFIKILNYLTEYVAVCHDGKIPADCFSTYFYLLVVSLIPWILVSLKKKYVGKKKKKIKTKTLRLKK